MAVQAWTDMSVLFGEYDIACHAKSVEAPTVDVTALDTTAVCASSGWRTFIGGIKGVSWSADIMQDFDENEVDELIGLDSAQFNASTPLSVLPAGTAYGDLGYTFRAISFNYAPVAATVGDIAMANIGGAARQGPVVRGTILHPPSTARTSTGDGTGAQIGALSASQSMYVAVHITAASGTSPTLDLELESDDNSGFSSATSRITFTQATTTGWQWAKVDGAITDDYWRITYTLGGTSPSFEFAVIAGIAPTI